MTTATDNHVLRIPRQGMAKFALGDDGPTFELDLIHAHDGWIGIQNGYFDEAGKIPDAKADEWRETRRAHFQALVQEAYNAINAGEAPRMTRWEVEHIWHVVREEVRKLRDFLSPVSVTPPSPPANSDTRFAQ
jgi:hypothetical protein